MIRILGTKKIFSFAPTANKTTPNKFVMVFSLIIFRERKFYDLRNNCLMPWAKSQLSERKEK